MVDEKLEDLVIVGAGPAGLSAAIYAKQAGFNPLVLHSSESSLIATTDRVNNYLGLGDISGFDLAKSMENHFLSVCGEERKLNFEVLSVLKNSEGVFELADHRGQLIRARAVIWAAGAKPRKLGIAGEDIEAVSYCATCDGAFYAGDPHLVVVGGGDSAVEEALYLAELVDSVTLLVRSNLRSKAELSQRLSDNPKIDIRYGAIPKRFLEKESMEVEIALDGSEDITTSGVFVAIGHIPNSAALQGLVSLDGGDFVDEVNTEGLFVAGDIRGENHRQAIIAAGDGAKAGIEASDYLRALES